MVSARRRVSRARVKQQLGTKRDPSLVPAQSYQERRWLLDCFYKLGCCFSAPEGREKILPCLVDLLKPRIDVQIACFLEQRDELRESVWHSPYIPVSEIKHVKAYAASHLLHFGASLTQIENTASSSVERGLIVVLPLFVDPSVIFGVVCLRCPALNESSVTLLHALGNHIALALDHQYQLDQQKKAAEELRKLEIEVEKVKQFRKLAESLPHMIWTIQDQARVTYANHNLEHYLGIDATRLNREQWLELCHPEDRQSLVQSWNKALHEQTVFEMEHRLRRSDGTWRWHWSLAVPEWDDSGRLVEWVGTCTDIHEKKQAQEDLKNVNRRLRLLSEIAGEIMRPQPSTAMIEKAVGKLASQLPFDMFLNLLVEPGRAGLKLNAQGGIPPEYLQKIHDLSLDDTTERQALDFFHNLGAESCAAFPLHSQDKLIGYLIFGCRHSLAHEDTEFLRTACDQIAVALDRTLNEEAKEQAVKALEKSRVEAESANQAKSLFLANMSHEIRTPIGVILGFADLASSADYPDEERLVALQKIKRNGQELAQLVDDILDLTKVETGHLEIEKVPVDLGELLEQVMSLLRFKADSKGIGLLLESDRDIPYRLITDPLRLRQCLVNIVGNAIKFTEQGQVHVRVCSSRDAQNRRLLKFVVSDTGVGLTEEQQSRLFNNFSQANASTSRKFGGTGLGLALSRNLARALGGDLYLEHSVLGQGSTFILSVGITEIPRRAQTGPRPRRPAVFANSNLDGVRVLVVEDSPDNQMLIKRYLEMAGAEVMIASDGREGVTKALEGTHDLVLMDIQMPYVDGYQATSSLRESGYKKPVIALTANAMRGDKERSMQAGFTDHLSKPIHPGTLLNVVSCAVKNMSMS